jgi:hypothetical protein
VSDPQPPDIEAFYHLEGFVQDDPVIEYVVEDPGFVQDVPVIEGPPESTTP